ncbi:MAG: RNA polymerase sigma factor SigZ [Vicingaceae bacterium]|nr:RNA polymerase sigma factor SigZ [Vicingaceae bacterium]
MNTEKIWSDFNSQLLGFIKSKVNNQSIAKDILQDVFVKIHLKSGALADNSKLQSWLYQITRNTIIDYYRKKKLPLIEELSIEIPEVIDNESMLEFCDCLIPFIDDLPEKYRDAILKTELGNLSQKDYARQLGISYSALKSRVQRGKVELKKSFISCCHLKLDSKGKIIQPEDNCSC